MEVALSRLQRHVIGFPGLHLQLCTRLRPAALLLGHHFKTIHCAECVRAREVSFHDNQVTHDHNYASSAATLTISSAFRTSVCSICNPPSGPILSSRSLNSPPNLGSSFIASS